MTPNTTTATRTAQAEKSSAKPTDGRVADAGDGEVAPEQPSVGLDDREDQHAEAPEGEGMRHAGYPPSQQPALLDYLFQFEPGSPRFLGIRPGAGLPEETSRKTMREAPARYRQRDRRGGQADRVPREHTASRWSGLAVVEVLEIAARGRPALMLVLGTEACGPIRDGGRSCHLEEADLADLHAGVQGDREVRHVGELEGQVTVPPSVHETGRRMDQEPEPAEARLALEATDEVVGEGGPVRPSSRG